jgi:hypothetical protein
VKRVSSTIIVVLCALLLAACGTLPDGKPFADATGTWSASVRTSGQAISDSLRDAGSVEPRDKAAYDKLTKDFEAAWSERIKAAQGVVAYSNAIADLLAASKESAETIKKAGDALEGLATAVGIPVAAPVVGVATDLASFVFSRIAIVRAQRQLDDAVAQAQPAVDRIAIHLVDEANRKLKPYLKDAYDNIVNGIKDKYDADDNFAAAFRGKQAAMRQATLNDPAKVAQLQEFDKVHANVAVRLKERDQKIDEAAAAYKARLQLVNALSTSTMAWAQAHRDLAAAIKEKRKVNAAELQETIVELKDLIKKVRAL